MGFSRSAPLTGGGTISGDLTITGDLTIQGSSTNANYDEILQGNLSITGSANMYISIDSTQTNGDEWQIINAVSGSDSQLQFKNVDETTYPLVLQGTSVGIGATTVDTTLHIERSVTATNNLTFGMKMEDPSMSGDDHLGILFSGRTDNAGGKAYIGFKKTGNYGVGDIVFYNDAAEDDNTVTVNDNVMVFNKSGNLGIGTTAPGFGQDAGEAITNASTLLEVAGTGGNADGATIVLRNTATAIDASTDSELGMIKFAGNDTDVSLNEDGVSSMIRCLVTDTWNATTNDRPSQLEFWTTADGSGAMAQNMTINKNGHVGIGTSTAPDSLLHLKSASDYSLILETTGTYDSSLLFKNSGYANRFNDILFEDSGGQHGRIRYNHLGDKFQFMAGSASAVNFEIDNNSRISLSNNDAGASSNTIFGHTAGNAIVSGAASNVLIGHESGLLLGDAGNDSNTAVGSNAMKSSGTASNNTAYHNTAIGSDALAQITLGGDNVCLGSSAGYALTTANKVVFIGRQAGDAVTTTGGSNVSDGTVAVGYQSLSALTSGSKNTALGFASLSSLTTGSNNIAIGYQSMDAADGTETNNIAIGYGAMGAFDENGNAGDDNIAIGVDALKGGAVSNNTRYNIAIGNYALDATATNPHEGIVAIGHQALSSLTSGAGNVAVGYQAGIAITTETNNTIIGYQAGLMADGNGNTYIGQHSGKGGSTGADTDNVAVGKDSMFAVTDGSNNVAIGKASGNTTTTGDDNTTIGKSANVSTADAQNQTAIGKGAVGVADNSVTLGNTSVIGVYHKSTDPNIYMINTTAGDGDGARDSSIHFKGTQSGAEVTTLGKIEVSHDSTSDEQKGKMIFYTNDGNDGDSPTARLTIDSDGSLYATNSIIYANYFQSTTNNSSGYSSVFIHDGNNADRFGIVSRAGVDSPSSAGDCIYMKFQDGDGGDGGAIRCSSSVGTPEFVAGSDKRIKKDIKDTSIKGIETIKAIPLKEFNWKSVKERPKTPIGIIADDLEKILPDLVAPLGDETGWEHCREDGDAPLKAIPAESQITLILMKAVQELTAKVEALEKK